MALGKADTSARWQGTERAPHEGGREEGPGGGPAACCSAPAGRSLPLSSPEGRPSISFSAGTMSLRPTPCCDPAPPPASASVSNLDGHREHREVSLRDGLAEGRHTHHAHTRAHTLVTVSLLCDRRGLVVCDRPPPPESSGHTATPKGGTSVFPFFPLFFPSLCFPETEFSIRGTAWREIHRRS